MLRTRLFHGDFVQTERWADDVSYIAIRLEIGDPQPEADCPA